MILAVALLLWGYRQEIQNRGVVRVVPSPMPAVTVTVTPSPGPSATVTIQPRETVIIERPGRQTVIVVHATPTPQPTATVTCNPTPVLGNCRGPRR